MEKILVVAPHPDDETLGMGGTIAKLAKADNHVTVVTVAAHMPPLYSEEIHRRTLHESMAAHKRLGVFESRYLGYAAVSLKNLEEPKLNGELGGLIQEIKPTQVYIPFYDRHTDHRATFEAAMVATRPVGHGKTIRLLAAYETLTSTHWNAPGIEAAFNPTMFVDIGSEIDAKLSAMAEYASQLQPFPEPRSLEALSGLAQFRGSQSGTGFAEAFQVLRLHL